ncbi:MAG: DUF6020 family protein [Lachnospiraceae bacterium]
MQIKELNTKNIIVLTVLFVSTIYVLTINGKCEPVFTVLAVFFFRWLYSIYEKKIKNWKTKLLCGGYAVLLGAAFIVGKGVVFNGDCAGSYIVNYIVAPKTDNIIEWICLSILIYLVTSCLAIACNSVKITIGMDKINMKSDKIWWGMSTIVILLAWLPHLLSYYPGVIIGDSLSSIGQALGSEPLSNHFPIVYTFFIKACMEVGIAVTDNINVGIFIYTFIQYVIMAVIAGYVVFWLKSRGVNKWICLMTATFYALCGLFAGYAVSMWKDPLFGAVGTLLVLYCLDIVISKGSVLTEIGFLLKWNLVCVFLLFWRNNGLYIVAALGIIIVFLYRKYKKRLFVISFIFIIIIFEIITGPIYDKLKIEKDTIVESMAIPIQQIAGVVVSDADLTKEQEEVLFQILPEEEWKCYTPALVDRIKFHDQFNDSYFNEHVGDFLKIWAELLVPNLKTYVKSYLMETIGYWHPTMFNGAGYFYSSGMTENEFGVYTTDLWEKWFGKPILPILNENRNFICSGALAWIILLGFVLTVAKKYKGMSLGIMPALLLWGTVLIATPIAFSLRYVFLWAFGLPIFLMIPFMSREEEKLDSELK